MRLLLLLAAGAIALWLLLRRRDDATRVGVGWADGSELDLGPGPERDRLAAIAQKAFA